MDKLAIRKKIRLQRHGLSKEIIERLSQQIVNRLVDYRDWQTVKNLHIYQTIERLHEVDTKEFIDFLKSKHPDIKIYHPESKPRQLDVVIVPLLAFDQRGYRVGH